MNILDTKYLELNNICKTSLAKAFLIAVVVAVSIVMSIATFFAIQSNIVRASSDSKELPANASRSLLRLIQTIPIPNVNGRIDHMAVDTRGQKLFVAELENNSVDVVDLKAARRIHSINNNALLNEPQSIIFIPELNRIFVSNGQDGTVDVFGAKSFNIIKKIKLASDDADNMRYDPNNKLVYVGYGEGSLGIINATNYNIVGNIKLTGHPESFQIEEQKRLLGQQQRIFVNVPEYQFKIKLPITNSSSNELNLV
jgi:hypothetical protein